MDFGLPVWFDFRLGCTLLLCWIGLDCCFGVCVDGLLLGLLVYTCGVMFNFKYFCFDLCVWYGVENFPFEFCLWVYSILPGTFAFVWFCCFVARLCLGLD